jgi:hypothetical protein
MAGAHDADDHGIPQSGDGFVAFLRAAIDPAGLAAVAVNGFAVQETDRSLWTTTSTPAAPSWTPLADIARCPALPGGQAGAGLTGGGLQAAPSGGLAAAWGCDGNGVGGIAATVLPRVGAAAFDANGPPMIAFRAGRSVSLTLGEPASWTVAAARSGGGPTLRLAGSATAGKGVTRALPASARPGSYRFTRTARGATGNVTTLTRTASVT